MLKGGIVIRSQKVNKEVWRENELSEAALQQKMLQEQQDLQDKLQRIAKMRMFDDTLMNAVFDSRIEETQVLIQIILGRDDIRVISTKTQEEFINVYAEGSRWTSSPVMPTTSCTTLKCSVTSTRRHRNGHGSMLR